MCPRSLCRQDGCAANDKHPMFSNDHEYLGRCPTSSSTQSRADEQDVSRDKQAYRQSRQACPSSGVMDRVLSGRCSALDEEEASAEPKLLHDAMMTFIRTLLRGICIEVLLDDGSSLFPEASLNYELTSLILDVNEAQRTIPLRDVEDVVSPQELQTRNILTSIQPFLDERCCTLIIKEFEFVTFRFDTERLREYFATCLLMLISRGEEGRPQLPYDRDDAMYAGRVCHEEVRLSEELPANVVEAMTDVPSSNGPSSPCVRTPPRGAPLVPGFVSRPYSPRSPAANQPAVPGLPRESSQVLPHLNPTPEGPGDGASQSL